jgi:hypothetical protein
MHLRLVVSECALDHLRERFACPRIRTHTLSHVYTHTHFVLLPQAARKRLEAVEVAVAARQQELAELGAVLEVRSSERDHTLLGAAEQERRVFEAQAKLRGLQSRAEILEQQVRT